MSNAARYTVGDTVEATVTAELPQQLFRLQISDGTVILAGRSEELGRLARPIRTGARVLVRRARLDPSRGTIVALVVTGEAGAFVERRFGPMGSWRARAELRQGFGGHQGLVGDLSLAYAGRSGKLLYSVGPRTTFASRDYVQTYFGVDAGQAARTGLAVSRPGGGLVSFGLGGTAIRPLDRNRTVSLFGGIDRLGDAPAGTSLIRQRGQRTTFNLGLAYSYRFRL